MDDVKYGHENAARRPLVDGLDHRVALWSALALVLATCAALTVGGSALTLAIGALLLGIVGLAAAAL